MTNAPLSFTVSVKPVPRKRFMSLRRIGGLTHWRIGNYGGSFYRSRSERTAAPSLTTGALIGAVAATLAATCVPGAPAPSYAAIVTLADGNEYQIERGTLDDCQNAIANMSPRVARCELTQRM